MIGFSHPVYDATGAAGPDVVLWKGSSGDYNITVITTRAFEASVADYEKSGDAMKMIWLGFVPPVLAILWNLFTKT
jgi:hypothetical protein